jgi:hypothetical protein
MTTKPKPVPAAAEPPRPAGVPVYLPAETWNLVAAMLAGSFYPATLVQQLTAAIVGQVNAPPAPSVPQEPPVSK